METIYVAPPDTSLKIPKSISCESHRIYCHDFLKKIACELKWETEIEVKIISKIPSGMCLSGYIN